MSERSLWGDLSSLKHIRTPKTILAEQASFLNDATQGLIRAQVSSAQSHDTLSYSLNIVAPVLNNYTYSVCTIQHDVNMYPCRLFDFSARQWLDCADEAELTEKLGIILASEKTKRIIESLLSQSQV